MERDLRRALERVRERRPLVHCITNVVTIGRVADAIAALGARPIMASAPEEVADVAAQAQALLLNLGTPSADRWEAARQAAVRARQVGVPVVVDPVGCGATTWRTDQLRRLVAEVRPDVVRGNAPEVAALAGLPVPAGLRGAGVGVEDRAALADLEGAVLTLAREASRALGATLVATGRVDCVADPERVWTHRSDAPALEAVVGAGDVLSAAIACLMGAGQDAFGAARAGLTAFAAAAAAAARSSAPGGFWLALIDSLAGSSAEQLRETVRVYLLADTRLAPGDRLPDAVSAALGGGVTLVQLRMKGGTTLRQVALARELRARCHAAGVPFLVNDRVDVALASRADGAHVGHLGQEDLAPADARRLLGPRAILGVSVGSAAEAEEAERQGAGYVSAGPMFATGTKGDAGPAPGAALLRQVRSATALPLVVIGGITPERCRELFVAGADGVCVGSGILRAPDAAAAARAIREAWEERGESGR